MKQYWTMKAILAWKGPIGKICSIYHRLCFEIAACLNTQESTFNYRRPLSNASTEK
jgi:hypothetical protein